MNEPTDYITQVQRGIDYLEEHLDETLSLRAVSKAGGISHWHFQRIFKALTGETLKTYVRSRRMANALDRLLSSKLGILQLSLEAGFESQAAFSRAFKTTFGLTPGAYRKIGARSLFLRKARFDADYLKHLHAGVSQSPRLVEHKARRFVGLRTEFYGVDSERNNVAHLLPPLWEQFVAHLPKAMLGHECYGVIQQLDQDDERLVYHAAVLFPENAPLPAGMHEVRLPASLYATFEHSGPVQDLDHTVNYIYSGWLSRSGQRHSYGADIETYGPRYHPTSATSVIEYAIPIESTPTHCSR